MDVEALWALAPRVQAYAMRHVDRASAEDVLAETFLVAWRRRDDIPDDVLPWLLVVARNVIATDRRRAARRPEYPTDDVTARLGDIAADPVELVTERDALLRAIADLSADDREALLLVSWDGLTTEQAAVVAGCTAGASQERSGDGQGS